MKVKAVDFILWPIALILLYLITHLAFTGIFYAFEFIVRLLSKLRPILYILLIIPAISFIITPVFWILVTLCKLIIGIIVRQWKLLTLVFGILLAVEIIVFLIGFWIGTVEFSWESFRYVTINKLIFSFLMLSFLYLPVILYFSFAEDTLSGSHNS